MIFLINENIRKLLDENNLKQLYVAKMLRLTPSALSQKLSGLRKFNTDEIIKIKKLLNCSYEQILEDVK